MWARWLLFSLFLTSQVARGSGPLTHLPERAQRLQSHSIVFDTHVDTTQLLLDPTYDLGERHTSGSLDIPRLREGGLNAVYFSIWVPASVTGQQAVNRAFQQIAAVRRQVRLHPRDLALCTTAMAVRNAHAHGKIAVLMGMEGGHMLNHDLALLKRYAALGVSYVTLTHSLNNDLADSATDKPQHGGLTPFGKRVIQEMNKLGMLVDISHVSDQTFYAALAVSRVPVFASHSSCRAISAASRNMNDDMIKALAAKGGVIQINFNKAFLDENYRLAWEGTRDDPLPSVSWKEIIDHIEHVIKLVGVTHVGLGSDFDGADMPEGMQDVTGLPRMTEALLAHGYSEEDVKKILGENILRLMEEVRR